VQFGDLNAMGDCRAGKLNRKTLERFGLCQGDMTNEFGDAKVDVFINYHALSSFVTA
tara:strand:- start:44020 stop:44190 length:171 start_codon:yes stop_codon:yes gene_type:complete